jgi:hypothetical protein
VFFVNEARSLFELMTNKRSVKFFFAQTPTLLRTDDPQGRRARLAAGSRTGLGAGRAKLRLSRGSRVALICDVTPQISRSR